MPEIETTRPWTLLFTKVGTTSVAKKLVGYDRVILPPTGRLENVVKDSVTKTPPFEAIRSFVAMVRATLLTSSPARELEEGWAEQVISLDASGALEAASLVAGGAVVDGVSLDASGALEAAA